MKLIDAVWGTIQLIAVLAVSIGAILVLLVGVSLFDPILRFVGAVWFLAAPQSSLWLRSYSEFKA